MIIDSNLGSGDNSSDNDQSLSPNQSNSSVDASPQGPLPFNSGAPPSEPAQPEPPVPGFTPTAVDAAYRAPPPFHPPINPPTHNPVDTLSTNGFSPPASPAHPTITLPVSDSSTRLSAIQTVQTYLTSQTHAIQSHLTAVLPGLIQGEVRTQCTQLAQEIGAQILSIREEVNRSSGDQDDPMLPSDDGENEGSRGRGKRSTRCSRDKGKGGRFATHSDNEADNEDEGDDEEEISADSRKYKKQIKALRVSVHSCFP